MRKGKRFLSLALTICAISLSACSGEYTYPDNKWEEGKIATIGGKTYEYSEIYKYFDNSKASAQAYFTVAKNVAAQLVTPVTDGIKSDVDLKINTLHDTWKSSARSNSTSYKEEQEKTFTSENVDSEDELRAKYIADAQIKENSDAYTRTTTLSTGDSYVISKEATEKYVENTAPYHVSHILIRVDASSSGQGYYAGQISSDDAKQLGNVTRMLTAGDSFGSVAQLASDDSSSAVQYGECWGDNQMSAMQLSTSYINEFKLGLYAYDAFLNPDTTTDVTGNASNDLVRATLRVPGKEITSGAKTYNNKTNVAKQIGSTLVGQSKAFGIPVSVAFTLQYLSEEEKNPVDGSTVQYASTDQYPRNILFNNYFNYRGVNFMYNDAEDYDTSFWNQYGELIKAKAKDASMIDMAAFKLRGASSASPYVKEKAREYHYVKNLLDSMDTSVFKEVRTIGDKLVGYNQSYLEGTPNTDAYVSLGTGRQILCDTEGHPIVIARGGSGSGDSGYQGIHFIIVNNDPFVQDANGAYTNKYQYYRVNDPETSKTDFNSASYAEKPSFINFVKADQNSSTTYNKRKETVIKMIKDSDKNSDISLYESNKAKFKEKYGKDFDEAVLGNKASAINKYIKLTLASTTDSDNDTLDSSWETYIKELNLQQELASERMIPTVCVRAFESGKFDGMEDICHVEKK